MTDKVKQVIARLDGFKLAEFIKRLPKDYELARGGEKYSGIPALFRLSPPLEEGKITLRYIVISKLNYACFVFNSDKEGYTLLDKSFPKIIDRCTYKSVLEELGYTLVED